MLNRFFTKLEIVQNSYFQKGPDINIGIWQSTTVTVPLKPFLDTLDGFTNVY
jgi:hypothetical protein